MVPRTGLESARHQFMKNRRKCVIGCKIAESVDLRNFSPLPAKVRLELLAASNTSILATL